MDQEPPITDDTTPSELDLAERLSAARPLPSAGFRGTLWQHLALLDPAYGPRPPRLRLIVAGYLALGLLLIALGAVVAL
jgi:hypothetical protein